MPRTYIVSWNMNGSFEVQAEDEAQVEEMMRTMNRQELVFKCRSFEWEVEEIDRSSSGAAP